MKRTTLEQTISLHETLPSSLVCSIRGGLGVDISLVPDCPFSPEQKWSTPYTAATIVLPVCIELHNINRFTKIVPSIDTHHIQVGKYFEGDYSDPHGLVYNENSHCIFLHDLPVEQAVRLAARITTSQSGPGFLIEDYFHRDVFLYHVSYLD